MKKLILLLCVSIPGKFLLAQKTYDISFKSKSDTVAKSRDGQIIHRIEMNTKNIDNNAQKDYKFSIEVNKQKTSLPTVDYTFDIGQSKLTDLSKTNYIYLIIEKDSLPDRTRSLHLTIKIKKADGTDDDDNNNTGTIKETEVIVKGVEDTNPLNGFNYLAYIGTNFDLVDGIKAKNLFFAANVFLPPLNTGNTVGAYLSLYGNRTMTASDSTSNVLRTSKHVRISDTSFWRYTEQTNMTVSRVSDNLGAYINPLIKLWGASKLTNPTKLYFSPSLEFIWRRTETSYNYSGGKNADSIKIIGQNSGTIEFEKSSVQFANEFSFNAGFLGFFLVHENKQISMRVHVSMGYSSNYYPERPNNLKTESTNGYKRYSDMFFSGRAWITEATTGITLQAEVTNTLINSRPFYGVTLSKAINFKNLGTIFSTNSNPVKNHLNYLSNEIKIIFYSNFSDGSNNNRAKKNKCVSCIAEGKSGAVVKHVIECDNDADYLNGFEDGLIKYYKENGDTVTVKCLYKE